MKTIKRNAVIITVLVFVCAAAYLNWSYDRQNAELETDSLYDYSQQADSSNVEGQLLSQVGETTDTEKTEAEDNVETENTENNVETENKEDSTNETGLYYTGSYSEAVSGSISEYFSQVRLERTQARDEASMTLQTVALTDGASQEVTDEALEKMTQIADWTVKEAEVENLILAKGFIDCVVFMSEDGVSVTVAAEEGLSNVSVAKITDIILAETDYTADDLTVIEVK